jgi:medium-chain acyl-[acyl-carrier-protein] hydrolase
VGNVEQKKTKWLVQLAGDDRRARVFAFPFSGGSANSYAHWRNWWGRDSALWAIEAPGRAARMAEPPIPSMDEIVRRLVPDLLPLLDRPYVLFGHSNGALMAFAVANRLLELGAAPPEGIILSGKRSPSRDTVRERVSTLPDDEFLSRLRALNGTPRELLDNPDIMRLFFPAIRADFATGETFTPGPIHPELAAVPALVLAGTNDPAGIAEVFAWTDIFPAARTCLLEGGHFFINTDPSFPAVVQDFCSERLGPSLTPFGDARPLAQPCH